MDAPDLLRRARSIEGLTLREMGRRAGTSHATLAAYEAGRISPGVGTLDRIVRSAGFRLDVDLRRDPSAADGTARGRELAEVLELAAQFPVRVSPTLQCPRFGAA